MQKTIECEMQNWELLGNNREYIEMTLPFEDAEQFFVSRKFNAITGEGEQRENFESHVKMLRREILNGDYTPASFNASVQNKQKKDLVEFIDDPDGSKWVRLKLDSENQLSLINGDHRFSALKNLVQEYKEAQNEEVLKQLRKLPISIFVYLNGDPKKDFVNLQRGKQVDASHLLAVKVQRKLLPEKQRPFVELAFDIAKELNSSKESPFYKQIRFDTRGLAPIPISSLCSRGASDIGTSLVGMARILSAHQKDHEWAVKVYNQAYKYLLNASLDAMKDQHFLTPPPTGTKGSATMLNGVMMAVIYKCCVQNKEELSTQDLVDLKTAVEKTLNGPIYGNLSGPNKRVSLRDFVQQWFSDVQVDKHQHIPVALVKLLSASTFSVAQLPKEESTTPKEKPKKKQKTEETSATPKKKGRKKKVEAVETPTQSEVVTENKEVVSQPQPEELVLQG